MKEKITFDNSAKKIFFQVNIGTPGIGNTQIYKRGNGDETIKIAESELENSNINTFELGSPESLENKSLAVQTIINFSALDKSLWPQLLNTISSDYQIWDDLGNKKNFIHGADDMIVSNDGKTVFVIKLFIFSSKTVT